MTDPALPLHTTPGKLDLRVEQFIKLREKKRVLKEQYEQANKPLTEMENLLSASIMTLLNELGAENVRTRHGTCFKTTRTNASLADPDAFMQHVIKNEQFELLDRKANTTAVKAYLADHGELPPGVNLNSMQTIGVHKKVGGGAED
jgi:hypothetical protein